MIRAVLLMAVLTLAGCSRPPLTQEAAARVIRDAARFREPGLIGVGRQDAPSDCKTKLQDDANWRALAKVGWLEVHDEDDYERESGGHAAVKCAGGLSGDALRAGATLNTNTYDQWRVPAAVRELVSIKSITSSDGDLSTVQFTYRWRFNAFAGQILQPSAEMPGTAALRFVAGSWQVTDFTVLPEFAPTRQP